VWITVLTGILVLALVVSLVINGTIAVPGRTTTTKPSLVERPTLPGERAGTAASLPGVQARCKDGTYAFVGGSGSGDSVCKDHGGIEQKLGR